MGEREKDPITPLVIKDRIYGEVVIDDPCAQELLESPPLKRLAHISQMGVYGYAFPHIETTRLEHSIGVYQLLQRFGASREEQIAGLLHDVSHTAFSHVADHLFKSQVAQDFQDKRHAKSVFHSEIPEILRRHHVSPGKVTNYYSFALLEQSLPDLCADRIDYTLRDAVVCGVLEEVDVEMFLSAFKVVDEQWVFIEPTIAQYFYKISVAMARDWWAPDWGLLQFQLMAFALRSGLDYSVITEEDLFLTDKEVWEKLEQSGKPQILRRLEQVKNIQGLRFEPSESPFDIPLQGKYRGTDPLVHWDGKLERISRFNVSLAKEAEEVKKRVESIKYIKIVD